MKRYLIIPLFGALTIGSFASAAQATNGQGEGHTPVTICHNVLHNPVTITVDDDSTTFEGHLNHLESGFDTYGPCPVAPTTTVPVTTTRPVPKCYYEEGGGKCPPVTTVPVTTVTTTVAPTTTAPTAVIDSAVVVRPARPTSLAYTGRNSGILAAIGFALVALGLAITPLRKRV